MYNFINAQEMQTRYPDTFEAPTLTALNSISIGQSVKVCHKNERFWVSVTSIHKDVISGTVDNSLVLKHPFKFGDIIQFKKHHIYAIWD